MGRKSFAVDLINNFVIDNFTPYAWTNLFEVTEPDTRGLFNFVMSVRPNDYHRNYIHSTNALDLPQVEYYGSYVITIPLLSSNQT